MGWNVEIDQDSWKPIFTSVKTICKEVKLKDFQFKFIQRIVVVPEKNSLRFGFKMLAIASTAVILILLPTPLSTVILQKYSLKRSSTGLMSLTFQNLIRVQKSYSLEVSSPLLDRH